MMPHSKGPKAWKEVSLNIILESFLKCCLSHVEDGMQDDILWDNSEQSSEGASPSENEAATERSLDKLSDLIKKMERDVHVVKILNFYFILLYFPLFFIL
jgi:hypothetical protein